MSDEKTAAAFIERLKERSFLKKLLPELGRVSEGDWARVVEIARVEGYDFTVAELKTAVPPGFFKGQGKDPQAGWARSTLQR